MVPSPTCCHMHFFLNLLADLTIGEVVGIAIACLIFLALIIAIPIIICCCCACAYTGIACFAARKS